MVEHPLWKEFFAKIRPVFKIPARKQVSTSHLDAHYKKMKEETNEKIANSKYLSLQCDGWSNLRNEGIINFIIGTPEPLLVHFEVCKENRHTGEYISEKMEDIMKLYGPEFFLVVIGDNASNMVCAFNLLKSTYTNIVPLGCLCHTLNLMCEDILKKPSIAAFITSLVSIVKTVRSSQYLTAIFNKTSKVALKLPVKTRWGSYLLCLKSMLQNKLTLQTMVINSEVAEKFEKGMKTKILDDDIFWIRVEKMITMLSPICELITQLETNH